MRVRRLPRRPGSLWDARGFSLLELGIVLAVAILLLTAMASTAGSFYRLARAERTGRELGELSGSVANAVKRGLSVRVVGGAFSYSFAADGVNPAAFPNPSTPFCFDLTRFPGSSRICPATGLPGPAWNPTGYPVPQPLPASSPITAMVGGDRVYANGYNAWCEPYIACVYPFRAEVLTCVPRDDKDSAGLQGAMGCGSCGNNAPLTGEPTACVVVARAVFSEASNQYSYVRSDFQYGGGLPANYSASNSNNAY